MKKSVTTLVLTTILIIFQTLFVKGSDDSLQIKLISAKHDTIRIELLNQLAFANRVNDPEKALQYANIAGEMSFRNSYVKGLLNSIKIKAIAYKYLGQYEKSMDLILKALKLAEIINDEVQVSNCYNVIGSIYQAKNNYDMAISYFGKSFVIEMKLGNIEQASIRLYNIGTVYEIKKNIDAALTLYKKSLKLEEQLNREEGIMYALYGIGGILIDKGDFVNAEVNLIRALKLSEKNNNTSGISYCTYELGRLYMKLNQNDKAIEYYTKSYTLAISINEKSQLKDVYSGLSTLYSTMGDYQKAYYFLTKYNDVYDSINSSESNEKISALINKYEIDKRDREVELLFKENEIKKLELQQSKNFRNYFIFMSLIVLIILGIRYSKKQKNTKATQTNQEPSLKLKKLSLIKIDFDRLMYSKAFWITTLNIYFFLYMLLFQPFGLINMDWIEKSIVLAIYTSFSLLITLIGIALLPKINKYFLDKSQIVKSIAIVSVVIVVYSLLIWLFHEFQSSQSLSFAFLLETVVYILIVSIFPIIIALLLSERMIYAQYIDKFPIVEEVVETESLEANVVDEDLMLNIETDNISETIQLLKSKLICIEANDNYSAVYYEKNGKVQKTLYRITLKRIESSLIIYEEFIRCHKSYIVNIDYLLKIVGNSQKSKMVIKNLDFEIPISRNFPNQILQSLKKGED
jgi:tetratricopeptide (TPR) repeat protein